VVKRTAEALVAAMRDKLAENIAQTMLLARQNVTNATPVDTEHARSNWVLSVGAPYRGVCGSREAVSYADQRAGDIRVRRYSGRDVAANRKIYLRNNVFYMIFLNRGWSQQAPANFIVRALTGAGATRHMPKGTRQHMRQALRQMGREALKGARKR
jgi:hypothetical protein